GRCAISFAISQRGSFGRRMIAGSLNRSNRKGSTAARLSGPPRLSSTTARRLMALSAPAMNDLNELAHMLGRRFRHNAMAQIEDQPALRQSFQNPIYCIAHRPAASNQQRRIEIALKRDERLQRFGSPVEGNRTVQAQPRQARNARIVPI